MKIKVEWWRPGGMLEALVHADNQAAIRTIEKYLDLLPRLIEVAKSVMMRGQQWCNKDDNCPPCLAKKALKALEEAEKD